MKKNKIILTLFSAFIIFSLSACTPSLEKENSYNENIEAEEKEIAIEEEIPTTFYAFEKEYTSAKDINEIEINSDIYDDQKGISHVYGEYKEIDFIKDLLYKYVNEDESVYEYLLSYDKNSEDLITSINNTDMNKLKKDLSSLRNQMELAPGEEMYLKLDKVTYEGADSNTNLGHAFKVRVAISRIGATEVPWNYFYVSVYEKENKLFAHLF
ncbi:MAG: hypothetical protein GX258_03345 [Clostridiales bacterium]|nr:hypothetical protein [Clostridiales bacterium]